MSEFTNRVYLPDGNKLYVSDDNAGDDRLIELHKAYGNLKVEICQRELGKGLDDLEVVATSDIFGVVYYGPSGVISYGSCEGAA